MISHWSYACSHGLGNMARLWRRQSDLLLSCFGKKERKGWQGAADSPAAVLDLGSQTMEDGCSHQVLTEGLRLYMRTIYSHLPGCFWETWPQGLIWIKRGWESGRLFRIFKRNILSLQFIFCFLEWVWDDAHTNVLPRKDVLCSL